MSHLQTEARGLFLYALVQSAQDPTWPNKEGVTEVYRELFGTDPKNAERLYFDLQRVWWFKATNHDHGTEARYFSLRKAEIDIDNVVTLPRTAAVLMAFLRSAGKHGTESLLEQLKKKLPSDVETDQKGSPQSRRLARGVDVAKFLVRAGYLHHPRRNSVDRAVSTTSRVTLEESYLWLQVRDYIGKILLDRGREVPMELGIVKPRGEQKAAEVARGVFITGRVKGHCVANYLGALTGHDEDAFNPTDLCEYAEGRMKDERR